MGFLCIRHLYVRRGLLQLLEKEAEHMICMAIQTEIDIRLPVLLCKLPTQAGKKVVGEQTQCSHVSVFYPKIREWMRALLCLLTLQQNWCVRNNRCQSEVLVAASSAKETKELDQSGFPVLAEVQHS